jgi:hypothetical protein
MTAIRKNNQALAQARSKFAVVGRRETARYRRNKIQQWVNQMEKSINHYFSEMGSAEDQETRKEALRLLEDLTGVMVRGVNIQEDA